MNQEVASDFRYIVANAGNGKEYDKISSVRIKELFDVFSDAAMFEIFGLSAKEKEVLKLLWKDSGSLGYAGKQLNLTKERVRQIYSKSLVKLKHGLSVAVQEHRVLLEVKGEMELLRRENLKLKKMVKLLSPIKTDGEGEPDLMNVNLFDLDLSLRVRNGLKNAQIQTVGDLVKRNKGSLLSIKNFGMTSLKELEIAINKLGIELNEE